MTGRVGDAVRIRPALPHDELDVRRVLDGALLDVPDGLDGRIRDGGVLVAVDAGGADTGSDDDADETDGGDTVDDADGIVLGVLVLDGSHVQAIAVRRRRRGNGIGSRLVEVAAERVDGVLTADFREEIRPFYGSLGFDIEDASEDNRSHGRLHERPD